MNENKRVDPKWGKLFNTPLNQLLVYHCPHVCWCGCDTFFTVLTHV